MNIDYFIKKALEKGITKVEVMTMVMPNEIDLTMLYGGFLPIKEVEYELFYTVTANGFELKLGEQKHKNPKFPEKLKYKLENHKAALATAEYLVNRGFEVTMNKRTMEKAREYVTKDFPGYIESILKSYID